MIETPSLRTRFTVVAVVLAVGVVLALDAALYLSLRDLLEDALGEVLDTRTALVEQVAADVDDPDELVAELAELGLPVVVAGPDGVERATDAVRRLGVAPPGGDGATRDEVRQVALPDGSVATVLASRAGVDATLQRLLLVEVLGSTAAVLVVLLVLRRLAGVVTRPIDRMASTADEIAAGALDQRLAPSDPDTELGRLAAAFDRMIDALEEAVTDAGEAERRSRRFLADAAHQLRTPLTGLRATAETLLAHPEGPDTDRLAGNLAREAARLGRLVDQLLRVARLDRGDAAAREWTDLTALVGGELERQQPLAPTLNLVLLAPDEPVRAACDRAQVREAVANLLDNARRFARSRIEVRVRTSVGAVHVEVRDDGPGVAPEMAATMFERFASDGGGTGLGLSIALAVAEAHDGSLRWDEGRFVLTLPVAALA